MLHSNPFNISIGLEAGQKRFDREHRHEIQHWRDFEIRVGAEAVLSNTIVCGINFIEIINSQAPLRIVNSVYGLCSTVLKGHTVRG